MIRLFMQQVSPALVKPVAMISPRWVGASPAMSGRTSSMIRRG
jgi:hypothetical protein